MVDDWQNGGFGIYVHWPFCAAKCPYCDFNSHVVASIDHAKWAEAYVEQIDYWAAVTPGRVVRSVFFGGGTPSLMAPETVSAILTRISDRWILANDVEITLEANPGSVDAGRFRGFAAAGVNRVSLGVQALNDADLKRLGRLHNVAAARTALEVAHACFDRVSFDLIYARQDQSLADWKQELREAIALCSGHLSLYQLTVEDGTAFGDRYKLGKLRGLPEEDLAADLFAATQEICEEAGFPAYEISNHARPGAESRHNLVYWRYGDYVGIGPGAHGRVTLDGTRHATEGPLVPGAWLNAQPREDFAEALTAGDQATEYLLMALRLREGLDPVRFEAIGGRRLSPSGLAEMQRLGMINASDGHVALSAAGVPLLNAVARELLPD